MRRARARHTKINWREGRARAPDKMIATRNTPNGDSSVGRRTTIINQLSFQWCFVVSVVFLLPLEHLKLYHFFLHHQNNVKP